MFPSNPFPQIPSSIQVAPPPGSLFNLEKGGVYFNPHEHSRNPFVSRDCLFHAYSSIAPPPSPPRPVMDYVTTSPQDLVKRQRQQQQVSEGSGLQYCDDHSDLLESVIYPSKKKMVGSKKDGHSKIYTAQGPRDRRVRLSIEIAQKFFVLQDLLGFDKASKTLDWLFTKSKTAIKELVEETKHSSSSTFSTNQCEVALLETINGGSDEDKEQKKSALKCLDGKRKKMTQKCKSGFHVNLARDQSRAEARARARARTKEKQRIKKLDYESKKVPDDYYCHALRPRHLTSQSSFWGQIESQSDYSDILCESAREQRFSTPSSMLYGYQHNLVVSDESGSQIVYTGLPKFTVVHEQQGNHTTI